jgi:translocation and assembly module TamB
MTSEDGETIVVPEFVLRGGTGTWTVGGRQQVGGKLDFHVAAEDVPVAVATQPELEDWDMTGTISAHATLGGTQQQPEIRGEVFGRDLTLFGVRAGAGHVQVVGTGTAMQITGPVGDDVVMWSRMRWEGNAPVQAKFTFDVGALEKYVPQREGWTDVGGQLQGTLTLDGELLGDRGYRGTYLFPKVVLSKGDYTEENTEPVRLEFDGDRYELKSFSLRGHGPGGGNAQVNDFTLVGTRFGEDDELDLKVKGSLDARLFETLTPAIDSSSGHVELSARVTGTQDHPLLGGSMSVTNVKLKPRDFPMQLSELSGEVRFNQRAIEVPRLRGILNGGSLSLDGSSVELSHFKPASYDVHALLAATKWRIGTFPETVLSGDLVLTGKADDPVLSGGIDVDRFLYNEDLELNQVIGNLTRKKLDAETFTKRSKVVRFGNLKVNLGGDVRVKNNLVATKLEGLLQVIGDDAHPLLRGVIKQAGDKSKAYYRGNEFNIDELAVTFTDSERITPEFDLNATTTVRDYRISLHAFGTPDDFVATDRKHVTLSSSPALSETDIATLLTLGYTSQDRSSGGNGAALGLGADLLSSLAGVDQAAARFIPKNSVLRDPSFRFTSVYSQAYGSMQPTFELDGKVLVDELHFRLQEPVGGGSRGMRMQGEYRFSDSGSVQMQLDRDNSDYNFPDVGLDLKLRWEMK